MATVWRLIDSGPENPYYNMAVDEALLTHAKGLPVLRFYRWDPPAVSIGYFQSEEDLADAVRTGYPLVRRITGGGAICHEGDLTFSVVALHRAIPRGGSLIGSYRILHGAIATGLGKLGLTVASRGAEPAATGCERHPFCFERTADFDLVFRGKKLVGSAQRREEEAFLQHGSIPICPNPFAEHSICLEQALNRNVTYSEVVDALVAGFEESLHIRFVKAEMTEEERSLAGTLCLEKYSSPEWNRLR
jgi:lipoate-protein ligase A